MSTENSISPKAPYEYPPDRSAIEAMIEVTKRDLYEQATMAFFDPRIDKQQHLLEEIAHNTNVERLMTLLFVLERELKARKAEGRSAAFAARDGYGNI